MDGLGLAPPGPDNPLSTLAGGPLAPLGGRLPPAEGFRLHAADATFGVAGLPQSATGGTALFTGVNAPALLGRHLHGMPDTTLRGLLARAGLLRRAREHGARAEFVNAYTPGFFARGRARRRSVTTVMAECSGVRLKTLEDLRRGEALYRDFTNRLLREGGHDVEILSPERAGARLAALAGGRDLTVYEYFQTDIVGHRGTFEEACAVVESLNRFLSSVLESLDPRRDTVLLCSDHGNVEDMSQREHTRHPVPLLLWGRGAGRWPASGGGISLCEVTPGILALLN